MSFASKTTSEFSEWLRCNNFSDQVINALKGTVVVVVMCGVQFVVNKHYLGQLKLSGYATEEGT
jgi:hypothetical protein